MGIRFTRAAEAKRAAERDAVYLAIEKALPDLAAYVEYPTEEYRCRGLSIRPGKGGSWLAVLKLEFREDPRLGPGDAQEGPAHTVVFAGGDSPIEALAELERLFESGEVKLQDDKYPDGTAKGPKGGKAPRAQRG